MKKTFKKYNKLSIALLLLFLFFCFFIYWIYSGELTNTKKVILEKIPFPMAIVNGEFVSLKAYHERQILEEKIKVLLPNNLTKPSAKPHAYQALINEAIVRQIAESKGVWVSQNEINQEFQAVSEINKALSNSEIEADLKKFNINANFFKQNIIKPELLETKLKVWHSSNENLNSDLYSQAKNLLRRAQQGEDFGQLAKNFSQANTEKNTNGDLGFVELTEVLIELRESLSNMKIADIKIIPSRFGLHIIKLEDINENKFKIRQIFLENNIFPQWFNLEKNKIKIIYLLNI